MADVTPEFLALLAHELRTPVAAIIGYHDLMREGILGPIEPRVAEGVERMRSSANQILALIASLAEVAVEDPAKLHVDLDDEDPREIVQTVIATLEAEAAGRSTNMSVQTLPDETPFHTDRERVQRALTLALHAAIKNTAGGTITVNTNADTNAFTCIICGARLDDARDAVNASNINSAAALRLAMAAQTVRPIGGTFTIEPETNGPGDVPTSCVTIRIPQSSRSSD